MENQNNCPLCQRILIDGPFMNYHHLIPKTFKGKEVIPLHSICHAKIHSVFSERELYNYYHTVDRILENQDIQIFIKWVQNKDPNFYISHKQTNSRKNKRRKK